MSWGRDERTPCNEVGTTLEGIEYGTAKAMFAKTKIMPSRASVPEATVRTTDLLQVLHKARAATNSKPGSPEHKETENPLNTNCKHLKGSVPARQPS